ncbi:uncharacterized protein LOC141606376 isoform X2 [Silene latifolia]|uniref:uncharacterized protein LOC141606376 isoform X2 n=1 Tax=Silene latifolia TaxID=37657 RepID=UPI003D787FD2
MKLERPRIKGRLNRLPSACVGNMVMATVQKGKPDLCNDDVFMYFEGFNPTGNSKCTSDGNWGFMLRSRQMLVVQGNVISSPAIKGTILPGITRKSILDISCSLGFEDPLSHDLLGRNVLMFRHE